MINIAKHKEQAKTNKTEVKNLLLVVHCSVSGAMVSLSSARVFKLQLLFDWSRLWQVAINS